MATRLPDRFQIGPWRCEIIRDQAAITAASAGLKLDVDGQWDIRTLTVTIRPNLPADYEVETVLHEVLHALTCQTGIEADLSEEQVESLVGRLAPALLDMLRRNLGLTAYLLDMGES